LPEKRRLDALLVERGLAGTREKAQRLVRAGRVTVDGRIADKPGHRFSVKADINLAEQAGFVSRGGDKLEAAFAAFDLDVKNRICIDVGSSTGGFTDCLLRHGAARVYAVDVGKGQLHWQLRNDERVVVMEKVNARYLDPNDFPDRPTFAAIDVSFISLTMILPAVSSVLGRDAKIVSLIKPQFEAGRKQVGKGGVVRDPEVREEIVNRIRTFGCSELEMEWLGVAESPVRGPAGNIEFLACWKCKGK
jgi:23S rRNA (cytidine1920-2'-O)/16S rRNA (cytidine1409-2'-O)-methyltransferase